MSLGSLQLYKYIHYLREQSFLTGEISLDLEDIYMNDLIADI